MNKEYILYRGRNQETGVGEHRVITTDTSVESVVDIIRMAHDYADYSLEFVITHDRNDNGALLMCLSVGGRICIIVETPDETESSRRS